MVRVRMNSKGARELLRSAAVQADLHRRARAIAGAAGAGMYSDSSVGPNRARAIAFTGTRAARLAEARGKALTKAIDAGRL